MITPAQRAEIRRLYFGEHWKVGTIAAALGVHHETVRAAVLHETGGVRRGVSRPSALDPFLPFVRDTLAQYPRLRATRLHEMLRQRGYPGSAVQVRRLVRRLRPQTTAQVYRRVVTLPAEQAQVDWGTFGKVRIGHGVRAVSGFVMVLGYARALFALFYAGSNARELPPWTRRRLRGLGRQCPDPGLRQPTGCGVGSARHRDSVSPAPARAGRALSLRAPALHAGAREREGEGRAPDPIPPPRLLCRPAVSRPRRPQRPVWPVAGRDRPPAAPPRTARPYGRRPLGPRNGPASSRCRRTRLRPSCSARCAPTRPPTCASIGTSTRFPTRTCASHSRSWPAGHRGASWMARPRWPAIGGATTPARPSKTPRISTACSPPRATRRPHRAGPTPGHRARDRHPLRAPGGARRGAPPARGPAPRPARMTTAPRN